jgi:hypothetical protein
MIEFVEECRREWKRLGVPDPVSNEMAADLTADIEEAEAEGGSAEDVLGDSFFDPRRFAAAWAGARGVTPSAPDPIGPAAPLEPARPRWHRPVVALALTAAVCLLALIAAAATVGRHGTAMAAPVRRILEVPGSTRVFGPAAASPPLRFSVSGPSFFVQQAAPVAVLAVALFVAAIVGLGLAVYFWSPWLGRVRTEGSGER